MSSEMAKRDVNQKNKMSVEGAKKPRVQNSTTFSSKNPIAYRSSVCESWAAVLKEQGMPPKLIDYVKKAEFEDWVMQQNHHIGEGLYYTDDFQDLPPRFQKKIMEIAYKIANHSHTPEEAINEMASSSAVLSLLEGRKEGESHAENDVPCNTPVDSPPRAQSCKQLPCDVLPRKNDDVRDFRRHMSHIESSSNARPFQNRRRTRSFREGCSRPSTNESKQLSGTRKREPVTAEKEVIEPFSNTEMSHLLSNKNQLFEAPDKCRRFSAAAAEAIVECKQTLPGDAKAQVCRPKYDKGFRYNQSGFSPTHVENPLPNCSNFPNTEEPFKEAIRTAEGSDKASPMALHKGSRHLAVDDPVLNKVLQVIERKEGKNVSPESNHTGELQKREECNRIDITISDMAEDLEYWQRYVRQLLKHDDFNIHVTSGGLRKLCLAFYDPSIAKQARFLLKKRKKVQNGPYIVNVSDVKKLDALKMEKCVKQSSLDVRDKVLNTCLDSITSMFTRHMCFHDAKIHVVEDELNDLKQRPCGDELDAVKSKLQTLLAMKKVFENFAANVMQQIKSFPQTQDYMETFEHFKNDFTRECNCLDGNLPIYSKKDEILNTVRKNQVAVIVADTGSGKSTQLVQYLFREGYAVKGTIICTQPRKIAAISICNYISGQMGSAVGDIVGYETGVRKKMSKTTKIVYMTDYMLLRRCLNPKGFADVSCVVVDEAHERSLYTDLLLGMLKKLLRDQHHLKVIITSATIDPYIFLRYFDVSGDAVVKVPGRMYPVEVKWSRDAYIGWDYLNASVNCAYDIHCTSSDGGILVFLTCPSETDEAVELFKKRMNQDRSRQKVEAPTLLCLHGRQSAQEQLKIFEPSIRGHRKIIFSTNSAETSLTVPDIKYVVDCGMAKELQYNKERKRSALVVGFVSRSSATQRKGRAGRTQSGVCYRLYSENNYEKDMIKSSPPEILRCPLQQALLKILELKIPPEKFDFINQPDKSSIKDAMHSLELLGAVCDKKQLTELGRKMAKLQLEPQLAKLVIKGIDCGVGYEMIIISALSSISGRVFCRNEENKTEADQEKLQFCHDLGDFYTFLIVFHEWSHLPANNRDQWCQTHFVNSKAMHIALNIVSELRTTMWNEFHLSVSSNFCGSSFFHEVFEPLLFECFSENIFVYSGHDKAGYMSPTLDGTFYIHPSSSLSYLDQKMPMFVVCSAVLRTSRNFLLNVTPISEDTITKAHTAGKYCYSLDFLKRLQVSPRIYKPLGEVLLVRHFLGKDGMKLKDLEKKVCFLTKSSTSYIHVSVQGGEIILYIQPQHHETVSRLIGDALSEGRSLLAKEEDILTSSSAIHFNFAMSSAGNIHDVILPGESRDVVVVSHHRFTRADVPTVLRTLEKYGDVVSHKFLEDSSTLHATYEKVVSVDKALDGLRRNRSYQVSRGRVTSFLGEDKTLPLFRIHVTWLRLACQGTGSIEFSDSANCIEASYKLTSQSIYVGDSYLVVKPSKLSDKVLTLHNLPDHAVDSEVESALKEHLSSHVRISNVTLDRLKNMRTTHKELEQQKRKLMQIFGPYAAPKNLVIEVRNPEPADMKWTAVVYFRHLEDCQNALSNLKDSITVDRFRAHMFVMLKSSLYCRPGIYKVMKKDLDACSAKYQALSNSSRITVRTQKTRCEIVISCGNVQHLVDMRREIVRLIEGRHILCSEDPKLVKLFAQRSRISFEEIERSTKTLIIVDAVRKVISIYGSEKACSQAEKFITNITIGSNIIKTKSFDLRGGNLPVGFLKELYRRYGYDLRALVKDYKLKTAHIDFQKHLLVLEGPYKGISEAESHLEDICLALSEKSGSALEDDDHEVCPVCFDHIVFTDAIRLENCGHAICKLCLQLQIKSEVFPVVCVTKDCGKPFFVEDFRKIFNSQPSLKTPFASAALHNFICKNQSEVHCCPVPDCPMIYRVGTKDSQLLCLGCENYICTRCHSLYHHGMSCKMFQNIKVDEDYPLKMWLSEDSANRKRCPNCSTAIEKDGGCNHVTCNGCQMHLCWTCLEPFRTSKAVYDHIPYCPANT